MSQFKGIVPYLFYDDAEAAMAWYSRVFGFEEIDRWLNDDGKIQNAEMRIGDTELWVNGGGRRDDQDQRPVWIGIWTDDLHAMYAQVKAAGIDCEPPVEREFGVHMLTVPDEFGYLWGFIKRA